MSNKADKEIVTMRTPFPAHLINKLPKGTKAQNDCPPNEKINCKVCGGWHHPKVAHLDYIGHAAVTDRLLDVDPSWSWEPLAYKDGLPMFDDKDGLWIKLTVNGVTRLGYGNAMHKAQMELGAREKEVIGDAIRNAAMRFGAALDMWFKGDLHPDDGEPPSDSAAMPARKPPKEVPASPDSPAPSPATKQKPTASGITVSAGQIAHIRQKLKTAGKDEAEFCNEFQVDGLDGISPDMWAAMKDAL